MQRKVVKHGTATLTISLPSKWVHQYNIKAGDELEVVPKNQELIISTRKEEIVQKAELTFTSENEWAISKILTNLYKTGYDEIKIFFQQQLSLISIKTVLPSFVGFEIVDQTNNSCVIKNISQKVVLDFNILLRRCFLLILQEYEFIMNNLNKKSLDDPELINLLEFDVKKFTLLCHRLVNQNNNFPPEIKFSYFRIFSKLMKMSLNCQNLYKALYERGGKINSDTIEYLKNAHQLFVGSYNAFYQQKMSLLNELNTKKSNLVFHNYYERIQKKADKDNLYYAYLADNIHLTCTFSLLPILASPFEKIDQQQ